MASSGVTDDVRGTFYTWQAVATIVWWLLVRGVFKLPLWALSAGSVYTRPSWMDPAIIMMLRINLKMYFLAVPISLAMAALLPQWTAVRVLAALAVSLYHLLETGVTNRHGEYPMLYASWAMVLPVEYASAAALGCVIHFVVSTGIAKLALGGLRWGQPSTMETYLKLYQTSRSMPPLSKGLNRWAVGQPVVTALISMSTLVLELLVVPGVALFCPPSYRVLAFWLMLGMHVGIAVIMSFNLALVFFTTLPCYYVGFTCDAAVGSTLWWFAVCVGLGPACWSLATRKPLPDNWPLSPISLFMWSGPQANALARATMVSDQKIVLTTDATARPNVAVTKDDPCGLIGRRVLCHGLIDAKRAMSLMQVPSAERESVAHDCVMRVIGFTLLQGDDDVVVAATRMLSDRVQDSTVGAEVVNRVRVAEYLRALVTWLRREERVYETHTGEPLWAAHWVTVADGKITGVLMSASEAIGSVEEHKKAT
eukprot:GFYU01017368.1.p1 GENE.GFYU01017368.1~~GFYU01017368.1.p1  ORF type:complete len:481 (-),score=89.80 GFYU01017368.1:179-1621(-)